MIDAVREHLQMLRGAHQAAEAAGDVEKAYQLAGAIRTTYARLMDLSYAAND